MRHVGNSLASGDPLNCTEREENQARLTKVSRDVEKGFDNLKLRTDMLLLDQSLYFEMINKATAEPVDSVIVCGGQRDLGRGTHGHLLELGVH